jgi:non-heme chloroperoxidase
VRAFQESTVAQPIPAGFLEAIVAESCKLPARVWKTYLRNILEADVPTETDTIRAPTLILWGDQDPSAPAATRTLLAAIPGAQLAVYHGTGHCPHWEQPQRAAADLVAFARRVDPAARGLIAPGA